MSQKFKTIIVDDERLARQEVLRALKPFPQFEVVGEASNAEEASALIADMQVDIMFLDIQMPEKSGLQLLEELTMVPEVIFTTAYDEYAVDAFRMNSVGYLLKPVTFLDLSTALKKIDKLRVGLSASEVIPKVAEDLSTKKYKSRFLVKVGEHINSIKTSEIQLFYADGRTVYLLGADSRKYIVDFKMEELDSVLSPKDFFRANRTFIININSIKDVLVYSNSRLKISLTTPFDKEIIVSREKVSAFKSWFDGSS